MEITDPLEVRDRAEWRAWLQDNAATRSEVWLVSWRVHTGRSSVSYSDAVEEALCFGWIDSTRKTIDSERYAQRYTPRRPGSGYSQTNRERLAQLSQRGLLTPRIEAQLARNRPEEYQIPDDILGALRTVPGAWDFFRSTPPAYQRIRAAYVDHARARPEEFAKRLANLVRRSERSEKFGYGIDAFF
jgi:uncharacterized protein YdeI (YjbR/CyaY-like superfamily)